MPAFSVLLQPGKGLLAIIKTYDSIIMRLVSLIPAQTGITAYWLDNAGDYALIGMCVNHLFFNQSLSQPVHQHIPCIVDKLPQPLPRNSKLTPHSINRHMLENVTPAQCRAVRWR
jgi:hypothetical protein